MRTGRSEATLRRAEKAGLTPNDDLAELLAHADIVFSICPPHGALGVARALAGFGGIVVDANAISPVDGGAHRSHRHRRRRPLRRRRHHRTAPLSRQARPACIWRATTARSRTCSEAPHSTRSVSTGAVPAASALKMTYAAWTKTTAALLVSIRDTAAAYGVDADLASEWAMSQPHLAEAWLRARQQSQEKGWRWAR